MSLRRNWFWLAALAAAVALSAVWIGFKEKPLYESHAVIALDGAATTFNDESLMQKSAVQAGISFGAIQERLTIRRENNGRSIRIVSRTSSPGEAASLVSAVVEGFRDQVDARNLAANEQRKADLDKLHGQLEETEVQLLTFETGTDVRHTAERKEQHDTLTEQMATLGAAYDKLLGESAPQTKFRIIEAAQVPTEAVNADPVRDLRFGGAMVVLGGLLFFVSRRRIHVASADRWLRTDTFGIPFRTPAAASTSSKIIAVSNIGAGFTNPNVILDYAEKLVATGGTVLIVDGEVAGALTEATGLTGMPGLSDFLAQAPGEFVPAWPSTLTGVFIMPAGTRPARIPALLGKPTAGDALASLGAEYSHVVINAPAILTAGEMRDLTPQIDGLVLVTPVERSAGLKFAAVRQVEEYGGRVIGFVEDETPQLVAA
jgi:Mrp family chromosome partitioning ATPase